MPNNSGVVGVLRALLTADTAQFDTSMRKAVATTQTTTTAIGGLGKEVGKLTPQAERMVKAFGGDRLLAQANNLAAAVAKIGGASKLTDAELKRVNGTVTEAIAKYKALGQTAPTALVELQKQTGPQGLTGQIKGLISSLGLLGPSIAAAFSATAIIGFSKSVLESADSLVKLKDQTGISFQGLQRLQRAGDDAGNSIDQITAAINQMQRRLTEAKPGDEFSKALDQLGINIRELRALDPASQFMAIGDAIKGIEDPALRTQLAMATMGRTGSQVLPTLTRGFDDLRGHVVGMSDDAITALDDFGDAMQRLARQIKDSAGNIVASYFDILFPIRAVVRENENLAKQLDQMTKLRQGQVSGLVAPPGLQPPTMSMEEADRIANELDDKVRALIADETKLNEIMARAFGLDKVDNMREMVKAIGGIAGLARMDAEQLKALNALTDAAIGAAKRNGQEVPVEWYRILEATRDNVGSLQEYLKTVQQLPEAMRQIPPPPDLVPFGKSELDNERIRKLLAVNTPGSGPFKQASREAGETIGQQMTKGIADAFEQVPHFLTSSIIHSGSFINGLKAIGVDMADAIVEPLIKRFVARIAGARLMDAVAGGATAAVAGAGAAAASSAAAGGAGAAAAGAGGFGGTLAAVATNPFTIAAAGAAVGGFLLFKHFSGGSRANDARDKDLSQFAAFDTHRDANNPPGFYGLAALLAKYKKSDLFAPFIAAHDPDAVRKTFAPIQAFMGSLGRNVKSYKMGGFVPPGVVQPAILHGPEWIVPESKTGAMTQAVNVNHTTNLYVSAIDAKGVREFVRSDVFSSELGRAVERNTNFIATSLRKGLAY